MRSPAPRTGYLVTSPVFSALLPPHPPSRPLSPPPTPPLTPSAPEFVPGSDFHLTDHVASLCGPGFCNDEDSEVDLDIPEWYYRAVEIGPGSPDMRKNEREGKRNDRHDLVLDQWSHFSWSSLVLDQTSWIVHVGCGLFRWAPARRLAHLLWVPASKWQRGNRLSTTGFAGGRLPACLLLCLCLPVFRFLPPLSSPPGVYAFVVQGTSFAL